MRVYLPSTPGGLAVLHRLGQLGPAPLTGCAVTAALREWYLSEDAEELEYAAMAEAARGSLRLLAADPAGAGRRVVVAVDVPEGAVHPTPRDGRAAVRVDGAVALRDVASVHADAQDAEPDVRTAVAALAQADAGDEDAQLAVDGAEDHELLWYATQELPDLVD